MNRLGNKGSPCTQFATVYTYPVSTIVYNYNTCALISTHWCFMMIHHFHLQMFLELDCKAYARLKAPAAVAMFSQYKCRVRTTIINNTATLHSSTSKHKQRDKHTNINTSRIVLLASEDSKTNQAF